MTIQHSKAPLIDLTPKQANPPKQPEQAKPPQEKPIHPFYKLPKDAQDLAMHEIERVIKSHTPNKAALLTRILDNHPTFLKLVCHEQNLYPKAVDACQKMMALKLKH